RGHARIAGAGDVFVPVTDMSRLKWAVILPAVQVAIAAIVFQWDYRIVPPRGTEYWVSEPRLIVARGLDAPALLMRPLASILGPTETKPGWISLEVLGFYSDDFFFLLGVAITWALAGRRLDRRNLPQAKGKKATAVALVISVLLVGMAVLLFFLAKHDFG